MSNIYSIVAGVVFGMLAHTVISHYVNNPRHEIPVTSTVPMCHDDTDCYNLCVRAGWEGCE